MSEEKQAAQQAAEENARSQQTQDAQAAQDAQQQSADTANEPADELEQLRQENAELKDKYLRALADLEQLRRRLLQEKQEAVKYAAADFARDMLTVCDNLSRAIEAVPEERKGEHELLDTLLTGVDMTLKDMLATFERHNIRKIPAHGEKFDPNVHEAMFEVETPDAESGTVVQVIQEGYIHHDRVLRPARVGVSKGSAKNGEGGQ